MEDCHPRRLETRTRDALGDTPVFSINSARQTGKRVLAETFVEVATTLISAPHYGGLLETFVLGELRRECAALPDRRRSTTTAAPEA